MKPLDTPPDLGPKIQAFAQRLRDEPGLRERLEREHLEHLAAARSAHEARELARLEEHLRACGVPVAASAFLAVPHPSSSALDVAAAWVAGKTLFLGLFGAPGTGKTTAAASVLAQHEPMWLAEVGNTWCWPTRRQSFVSAAKLARWEFFGAETRAALDRLCRVPVLVVDELGDEFANAPWLATFGELVNRRYEARKRTVLVGNMHFEFFAERYGRRVAERVRESGRCAELGESDRVRRMSW